MGNRSKIVVLVGFLGLFSDFSRASNRINGDPAILFDTPTGEKAEEEEETEEQLQRERAREAIDLNNYTSRGFARKEGYVGVSDFWIACEELLPKNRRWKNEVGQSGQGRIEQLWGPSVQAFIDYKKEQTDLSAKSDVTGEQLEGLIHFLQQCHSLLAVTGHSNYDSDEFARTNKIHERPSAVNPQMKCKAAANNTQDYPKCVSLIKLYDTFTFGKKAKHMVDTVRSDEHASDLEDKLVQERLKGNTIGVEDGLNVQKESFKKQKDITTENMTISAAEMTSLLAIINSMPTWKDLMEECTAQMGGQEGEFLSLYEKGKNLALSSDKDNKVVSTAGKKKGGPTVWTPRNGFRTAEQVCPNLTNDHFKLNLILNTDVREMAKALSIKSGIDAVANLAKGAILKQEDQRD